MGALMSNRKRSNDVISTNLRSPVSNSSVSEIHDSKRPKLSSNFVSRATARLNPIASVLKYFFRYPSLKSLLKREPHAPVRRARSGFSANLSNSGSKVSCKDNSLVGEMKNSLIRKYESAKRSAFQTFRFIEGGKEEEVSEASSIEAVEVLEDWTDQKWRESNGVVEDLRKFEETVVERDSGPSSSSVVMNPSNGDLKVECTEKLMESLSLSGELNVPSASVHQKLLDAAERRNEKLKSLRFEIEFNEKQWQLQKLLRSLKKKDEVDEKDGAAEAFKPLTKEEETEVARALANSSWEKLLVTHENSNISITGKVLHCLKPGAWLNDEVINLYLELLKEREKREPHKFLNCHFFNTFFYKKLISGSGGYNYQSVRRWTSQKKLGYRIFDCDKIFIPIHKEVHWCLAVISRKDEKFQYLDSLGGVDGKVMKALARYFADEVKDKSGEEIDVSSWRKEFVEDLPEQENGFDCGMFMIKYADFYSRDIGLCFNQEHMPYFRLRTAKEILRLKVE